VALRKEKKKKDKDTKREGKFSKVPSDTFRGDLDFFCGQIWRKVAVGKLPKNRLVLLSKETGFAVVVRAPNGPIASKIS